MKCPYCNDEKKPRGLKNHVRMSGGEHGESGSVPSDFADRIEDTEAGSDEDDSDESDSKPSDGGAERPDDEATTVGPDDFQTDDSAESDASDSDDGPDASKLPFDPSDDGCIRLDGGESVTIVADDGSLVEATANEGDYLLIDEDEGMAALYDMEDAVLYEVKTA